MRKKILTRIVALSAALAMSFGMVACGDKEPKPAATPTDSIASADNATDELSSLTAIEFTERMGNGINLGNTMEAIGRHGKTPAGNVTSCETAWGQPVTTPEMIQGMKDAGFDSIRIPVAWANMIDIESGDYTIAKEYLDRVEEIVNYAFDAGLIVVVNDHWDSSWWGMFGSASEETRQNARKLYTSMWEQIAERFKDYDSRLVLESANEELGNGFNDTRYCEDSGNLSDEELYTVTNEVNQLFVDTIRKSGGYNANRFLLIAGQNTNIDDTCKDDFVMPTDTVDSKLIVSVHYYDPWDYCGDGGEASAIWGTKEEYAYQENQISKLSKFINKGYGVIIGEWGVLLADDGQEKQNLKLFYSNFLDVCDVYNICPILWDTNGMYNKADCALIDDEVAELLKGRTYAEQSKVDKETLKADAKARIKAAKEAAVDTYDEEVELDPSELTCTAWIMFMGDTDYSVGDTYAPSEEGGIKATDVEITGEGTYTVALDFTETEKGYVNGPMFSAIGLSYGEIVYPGYVIDIKEILVNGEAYTLTAKPYTSSDDELCTRSNLYNMWVGELPDDARTADGDLTGASPEVINPADWAGLETLQITFEYKQP